MPVRCRRLHLPGASAAGIRDRLAIGAQRGDVAGWVLAAVMSAGLVVALWAVAEDALAEMLRRAISSVAGP